MTEKKKFSLINELKETFKPFLKLFNINKTITGINCIIRLGLPGSGKTLDQTFSDVLPHLLNDETVYSTYWLNWNRPNLILFNEFETVENVRNAVVVFDEIGQILPARQWEQEGLRVQLFFQLHRHRHIDIIANSQDVSLISKTVGIVGSHWYLLENSNTGFIDFLLSLFNSNLVMLKRYEVSFSRLKKMASGWEIEGLMPHSERKDKVKRKFYSYKKIQASYLDEYKIELVHKYCPKCKMRQGNQILKENTSDQCYYYPKTKQYKLKIKEYCPKHKTEELILKKSGIYDTDHEPDFPDKAISFQPLVDSPLGYRKIAYKGRLSQKQLEGLKALKKNLNA